MLDHSNNRPDLKIILFYFKDFPWLDTKTSVILYRDIKLDSKINIKNIIEIIR